MLTNLHYACFSHESDTRLKNLDALTEFFGYNYSPKSRPDYRGLGQRFTIADYRKLEKQANTEPFTGHLQFFEVPECDRIGTERRWKVSVWEPSDGQYQSIAGQFFKAEIDWLQQQYKANQDKGRFAVAIEIWLQRSIEVCNGGEVAA